MRSKGETKFVALVAQLSQLSRLLRLLQILLANSVYWLRRGPHTTPGRDKSGPYTLGVASLAVYGEFASSICCTCFEEIYMD